ncbi:hypothetical protein [Anaerotruncus rubiinfantis]|uniref:hypothetical protein n=1 Tax=Anaerotruncus rubiinfantis TaxID=1720200 RepID=UPI00082ACE76|nr:hypothetical protein [Anaerotruncus rubiinfantis]
MDSVQQSYRFTFKFEGEGHAVPLDTLCSVLTQFNKLSIHAEKNVKCQYSVIAHEPGSFEVELLANAVIPTTMFVQQNLNYILEKLKTIKEWIEVKRFLLGQKPQETSRDGSQVQVTNAKGDVMVTSISGLQVLNNASISNSIIVLGRSLADGDLQGFQMLDEERLPLLKVDKGEIPYLAAGNIRSDEENITVQVQKKAKLLVRKFIAVGNERWEFTYIKSFKARILDDDWLKAYQGGRIECRGGSSLLADLRAEFQNDEDGLPIDSTAKYFVTKVHAVIPPDNEEYEEKDQQIIA